MIKIDENDPIGEVEPSFPFRDVRVKKNTDVKQFYDLQKEIGRGKFGTVYKCRERTTGMKLAAKFISIVKRQDRRNAEKEVEIMRELQHPRLIQIYDAYEMNNIMCVVLELIEGGELFERVIDDDFVLTEKSVSVFMKQICEGVAFIHSKNVLHLDMKPENILCLTRNGNRIKIIDFGLARKYDPEKKLQVLFGTPEFVAPEVVNFDSIGFGTDMWSVGVICYVLLSGLSPFMGETDVATMANVTIAHYDFDDEAFNDISQNAKDFISKLLIKDRQARMSATECLSHPWLQRPSIREFGENNEDDNVLQNDENELLDYQKDTLRNIVDRWNSQTSVLNVTAEEMDELKLNLIELPSINNNGVLIDEKRKLINASSSPSDRVIKKGKSSHTKCPSSSSPAPRENTNNKSFNIVNDENNTPNTKPKRTKKTKTTIKNDIVNEVLNDRRRIPSKNDEKTEIITAVMAENNLIAADPRTVDVKINKNRVNRSDKRIVNETTKVTDTTPDNVSSDANGFDVESNPPPRIVNVDVNNSSLLRCSSFETIDREKFESNTSTKIEAKSPMETDGNEMAANGSKLTEEYANNGIKIEPDSIVSNTNDDIIGNNNVDRKTKTITKSRKIEIKDQRSSKNHRTIIRDGGENDKTRNTRATSTNNTLKNIFKNETIRNILQNFEQPKEKIAVIRKTTKKETPSPSQSQPQPPPAESRSNSTSKLFVKMVESKDESFSCTNGLTSDERVSTRDLLAPKIIIKETSPSKRNDIEKNGRKNDDTVITDTGKLKDEKTSLKQIIESNESLSKVADLFDKTALTRRRISDISGLFAIRNDRPIDKCCNVSDDMTSICDNILVNQLARMRNDSFSKSFDENTTDIGGRIGTTATKRPKFRMSFFSRDVPLQYTNSTSSSSTNCDSNLLNYLSWCVQQQNNRVEDSHNHQLPSSCIFCKSSHHSDPGSMRNSPERMSPPSFTKKILSKFFDASAVERVVTAPSSSTLTKNKIAEIFS